MVAAHYCLFQRLKVNMNLDDDYDIDGLGKLRFKKLFKKVAKIGGGKLFSKFVPYAGVALTAYGALSKKRKRKGRGGEVAPLAQPVYQPVYQPDGNVQAQNQAQAQTSFLPPSNPLEYQPQSDAGIGQPNLLLIGGGILLLILLMRKQ